jgi:hypothetical protein
VATTSPTEPSIAPSQVDPLPPSPTFSRQPTARPSSPAARRPKQGWPPDWQPQVSPTPATSTRSTQSGGDITAVGDSIMVDAMPNLRSLFPGMATDALAGRQVAAGLTVMQALASQGRLPANIVVELGTNGTFTTTELDRIFTLAAGRHLVLLTNHCGYCTWVPSNNFLMASRCTPDNACTVADWEALAVAHPEWFAHDGVHMTIGGIGAEAFAQLIARSLGKSIPASRLDPAAAGDPPPDRPMRAGQPS